jgi:hypothetical protein
MRSTRKHLIWIVALAVAARAWPLPAYTPGSPEVQRLVDRGLKYLDSRPSDEFYRLGGLCLAGLAFLKAGRPEHPHVAAALAACQAMAAKGPDKITTSECDIYSTGLAIIFLSALDGSAHRQEIGVFVRSFELRQIPGGAWGYQGDPLGDTSMTQYGALGLWEAAAAGYPVPLDCAGRMLGWLMRTQDLEGGWAYHPEDPGSYQLVSQSPIRLSLSTSAPTC